MADKKKKLLISSMRLDNLVEMGKGTLKRSKRWRKAIQVNGAVLKATDEKIDPGKDVVVLRWAEGFYAQMEYLSVK